MGRVMVLMPGLLLISEVVLLVLMAEGSPALLVVIVGELSPVVRAVLVMVA